jgi:hypothetical protein
MRWCPLCRRISPGQPERCHYCGRTWNLRLCPSGHENPPDSQYCGLCGSARLSEPAPGGYLVNRLFRLFNNPGLIVRTVLAVLGVGLVIALLTNFDNLMPLLLAIAFLVFAIRLTRRFLPDWLVGGISRVLRSAGRGKSATKTSHRRRGRTTGA